MSVRGTLSVFIYCASLLQSEVSRLDRAVTFAAKNDWSRVEEESRLYGRENPGSEPAAILHANALIHLSQPFDAALELEEFLKAHLSSVPAGKLYAALLVDVIGDRGKAEEVLHRCSEIAPGDPEVWEGLGKLSLAYRKPDQAAANFRKAAGLAPGNAVYAAELAHSLEDDPQAEKQYQEAIRLNEASAAPASSVYVSYAEFLAKTGRYAESIGDYTKALALDARSSDAYHGRATAFLKTGELRKAETDALAAIRENPRRRDSRQVLIGIYRAQEQPDKMKAQADALEAILAAEQNELAQGREMRGSLNQAESLLAAGKFADAIAPYERVIQVMPSFYEAYFGLGMAYQQTGQTAKAKGALEKYLSFQPLSADGHAALGLLLASDHRNTEARPELERAIQLNPELPEPRKALAHLLLDARDYKGAAAILELVMTAGGAADSEAFVLAANSRFSAGEKQKAIEICETGLRSFPSDAALEDFYALLLEDCGKTDACKIRALTALRQNPASPAYLKLVTDLLIETKPLDSATTDMVNRTRQSLPEDAGAQYLYAKWAYAVNYLDVALTAAEGVAAQPGADSRMKTRALTLAALTEDRLGDRAKADAAYREALNLNRSLTSPDPQAALAYVDFLKKESREAEAGKLVDEILRWSPAYGPAHLRRALALERAGRSEEAAREAQLALQATGDDRAMERAAHDLLAKTYSAGGRQDRAKEHVDWLTTH